MATILKKVADKFKQEVMRKNNLSIQTNLISKIIQISMIKLFTKSGVQVDMLGYIVSHPGIGSYNMSALRKQVMNHAEGIVKCGF